MKEIKGADNRYMFCSKICRHIQNLLS